MLICRSSGYSLDVQDVRMRIDGPPGMGVYFGYFWVKQERGNHWLRGIIRTNNGNLG